MGTATDLQGLEDDGLLENILQRRACMACGSTRRAPDMQHCPACWVHFEEILPGEMTISQKLQEFEELQEVWEQLQLAGFISAFRLRGPLMPETSCPRNRPWQFDEDEEEEDLEARGCMIASA